jgi:hypothetical protein
MGHAYRQLLRPGRTYLGDRSGSGLEVVEVRLLVGLWGEWVAYPREI